MDKEIYRRVEEFKKKIKGRFAIVRYHNDADGVVGAIYLNNILNGIFIPKWNVHYTIKEAIKDIQNCSSKDCIVILLDLGSSKESLEAIKLLMNAGIEIYIIDHHPTNKEIKEISLNPMYYYEDGAKYTAGYLAYLIAGEDEGYKGLWKISLAGDKSDLGYNEKERRKALVFDYLAYYDARLKMYEKVLKDENLFSSIELTVMEKVKEIENNAKKNLKKKGNVYVVNLGKVVENGFPGKGKALGIICSMLKEYTIVGYGEGIIMVRTSKDMNLEEELKATLDAYKVNYGGHRKAIAIRTEKGKEKIIVDSIVQFLNEKSR